MSIDYLINEYIKSEEINPKHHKRLLTRVHLISRFKDYLNNRDVSEIKIKEALEFQGQLLNTLKKDGTCLSSSTVTEYIVTVSGFYDFLKGNNYIHYNPFGSIKRLRVNKKIPRNILSEQNLNRLLQHFRDWEREINLKRRISRYRMHVISELMYSTGLRINEVANLQPEDINVFTGYITVRQGKGGYQRTSILNDYTRNILIVYLDRMRELIFTKRNLINSNLLFGMKPSYFQKYVNESLANATYYLGLNKITSHGFRHALGYHLLRSGCDIRHIQEILGHKSLKNTAIYTKVDKEDLKTILKKYHPRQLNRISDETND